MRGDASAATGKVVKHMIGRQATGQLQSTGSDEVGASSHVDYEDV